MRPKKVSFGDCNQENAVENVFPEFRMVARVLEFLFN